MIGAIFARYGKRYMSFVDQGFLGLSALLINVVLAHYLPVVAFASVSMMIGVHYFIHSIHRAAVVLPFILDDSAASKSPAADRRRSWWVVNLVFLIAIVLILGFVALVMHATANRMPAVSWISDTTFYLALTTPPLLAFEYGRRVLYQEGWTAPVAFASAVYFLGGMLTAGAGFLTGSVILGSLAFSASGIAGCIVLFILLRPKPTGLKAAWHTWRPHAEFAIWQAMTSIPYNIYTASAVVLIGSFGGPTAAAVFGVARTIVSPAFSIVSAVDSMDKPRAARAMADSGLRGLHASIAQTRTLLLVLAGGYLGVVSIFTPWILDTAFGARYADHVGAVRILAVSFFCMCLNQPIETMLIVLRKLRAMFYIRAAAAIAAVFGIWLGAQMAGVLGTVWALALVQAGVLAALTILEITILRRKS